MTGIAKLFMTGRSQAVRLPQAYRFEGTEVFIRRDPTTGDIVLSAKPSDWSGFVKLVRQAPAPSDFLSDREDVPAAEREII